MGFTEDIRSYAHDEQRDLGGLVDKPLHFQDLHFQLKRAARTHSNETGVSKRIADKGEGNVVVLLGLAQPCGVRHHAACRQCHHGNGVSGLLGPVNVVKEGTHRVCDHLRLGEPALFQEQPTHRQHHSDRNKIVEFAICVLFVLCADICVVEVRAG